MHSLCCEPNLGLATMGGHDDKGNGLGMRPMHLLIQTHVWESVRDYVLMFLNGFPLWEQRILNLGSTIERSNFVKIELSLACWIIFENYYLNTFTILVVNKYFFKMLIFSQNELLTMSKVLEIYLTLLLTTNFKNLVVQCA